MVTLCTLRGSINVGMLMSFFFQLTLVNLQSAEATYDFHHNINNSRYKNAATKAFVSSSFVIL